MEYVPTEKQNRNMKAKVLKYKFDGNTIVAPYMELEPYAENVFISLARKNEYGNSRWQEKTNTETKVKTVSM